MVLLIFKKNGNGKLLSIWWFFVIGIIALSLFVGVYIFYSASIDIRKIEASVLYKKITYCLNNNGYLNLEILENNPNIFKLCNLNNQTLSTDFAYIKIELFLDDINQSKKLQIGNFALEKNCEILKSGIKGGNFPICVSGKEYVIYRDESNLKKPAIINILISLK